MLRPQMVLDLLGSDTAFTTGKRGRRAKMSPDPSLEPYEADYRWPSRSTNR